MSRLLSEHAIRSIQNYGLMSMKTSSYKLCLLGLSPFLIGILQAQVEIPPLPEVTTGPKNPFSIYGPDWNTFNDVCPPLITLSDGSGVMTITSAGNNSRFVGPDLNHLVETDSSVSYKDAPGDNGAWHNQPGSFATKNGGGGYGSLIWISTLDYAKDGQMVGFLIGNRIAATTETWNGVGVSTDQGRTWQLLGEIPVGGCSVVEAPSDSGFYWYTIGDTAADNGKGTGEMLYASKEIHGAPGSWYVWNGPDTWVPISMQSDLKNTGTPLPTLKNSGFDYRATIIDDQYLAKQNGQAHEYLICSGTPSRVGRLSYDCIHWSDTFQFQADSGPNMYYNRIWDASSGGDVVGGQDLVEIWLSNLGSAPALTSRGMSQAVIHLGPLSVPDAPVIRDALENARIVPSVSLSWLGTQAQTYDIFRKSGQGGFAKIDTVPVTGYYTDYCDYQVTPGTAYQYYVVANNSVGSSPPSNLVKASASQIALYYGLQSQQEGDFLDGTKATEPGNYPLLVQTKSPGPGVEWLCTSKEPKQCTVTNVATQLVLCFDPNVKTTPHDSKYGGAGRVSMAAPDGSANQLWKIDAFDFRYMKLPMEIDNVAASQCLEDVGPNTGDIFLAKYKYPWNADRFAIVPLGQPNGAVVINASFETPRLPPGTTFQYKTEFNGWTFLPFGPDKAGDASGLVCTSVVPDGRQCAFIERQGSISQEVKWFPGSYTLSLAAVQSPRIPGVLEAISVQLDGVELGTITPSGPHFASYSVGPFQVSEAKPLHEGSVANHTLSLVGTGTSTGAVIGVDMVQVKGAPSNWGRSSSAKN